MIFIGQRLFIQIDSCLREANKDYTFRGRSIIIVSDLAQLPPIKDKPLYVDRTIGKFYGKASTL